MNKETLKNYLAALTNADKARNRAQQWGAWLIAEAMATSDQTFDEAVTDVRNALKEKGWSPSTVNNSLPLVPFACEAFEAGNGMPEAKSWPTKTHAENVLVVIGATPEKACGLWDTYSAAVEKDAIADLKADFKSNGVPDKQPTDEQIKLRVKSMAAKERSSGNGDPKGLFDNKQKLVEQLSKLTDSQLDELEEMIEAVRDKREAAQG